MAASLIRVINNNVGNPAGRSRALDERPGDPEKKYQSKDYFADFAAQRRFIVHYSPALSV